MNTIGLLAILAGAQALGSEPPEEDAIATTDFEQNQQPLPPHVGRVALTYTRSTYGETTMRFHASYSFPLDKRVLFVRPSVGGGLDKTGYDATPMGHVGAVLGIEGFISPDIFAQLGAHAQIALSDHYVTPTLGGYASVQSHASRISVQVGPVLGQGQGAHYDIAGVLSPEFASIGPLHIGAGGLVRRQYEGAHENQALFAGLNLEMAGASILFAVGSEDKILTGMVLAGFDFSL